jgi:hypothetical protein
MRRLIELRRSSRSLLQTDASEPFCKTAFLLGLCFNVRRNRLVDSRVTLLAAVESLRSRPSSLRLASILTVGLGFRWGNVSDGFLNSQRLHD